MPPGVYKRKYKLKTGPTPLLNDELFVKIRESILLGNDIRKTAKYCEINETTFYNWTQINYLNINDKIEKWKLEAQLKLAQRNITNFLKMKTLNKGVTKDGKEIYEYNDTGLVRVKADMSKFVAETLGNKHYAKVNRLADADGDKLSLSDLFDKADDK